MKSAKLLILAYRSHKKNLPDIASKLFAEAMADKTAPKLMEKLYKLTATTVPTKVKKTKADDSVMDDLSEETSTKMGWDEETESWNIGDEPMEQQEEALEDEGESMEEESEALEDQALELLKRARDLEEVEEEGEEPIEESEEFEEEEFGETGDEIENKMPIAKVNATQYAQLKAIANKLACKSREGAVLAHKLLASVKVKKIKK